MIKKLSKIKKLKYINVLLCAVILCAMFPLSPVAKAEDSEHHQILVSLGDSYSSGEGIVPYYGQEPYPQNNPDWLAQKVKNQDWLAHRSQKSWPGMLELPSVEGTMSQHRGTCWYFAAASGAETRHMNGEQIKPYFKKFEPLGPSYVGKENPIIYFSGALPPTLPKQLEVFEELKKLGKKADYVTLTLGGNDAGFSEVLRDVVTGSVYLDPFIPNYGRDIENLSKKPKFEIICDDLLQVYEDVAEKAGEQAQIIVVGYPQLLDPRGKASIVSSEEALLINSAVSFFNECIKQKVIECGASGKKICFVSVEEAFKGHGAYADDPFINGLIIGRPEVQAGMWDQDLNDFIPWSSCSFHPNEKGARAYADCVQKKIDELEEAAKNSGAGPD